MMYDTVPMNSCLHKKYLRGFVAVWLLPCLLLSLFACGQDSNNRFQTAGTINGIPVAVGELALFMEEAKQKTRMELGSQFHVELTSDADWSRAVEGVIPIEYAMELALRDISPYKLTQSQLQQQGLVENYSYRNFVEQLEEENASRLRTQKEGGVIYGPVQYTERVYYDHLQDERFQQLKDRYQASYTEADLKAMYDADPNLFQSFGRVELLCVILPAAQYRDKVADLYRTIQNAVESGQDFEAAVAEAGISDHMSARSFSESDLTSPDLTEFPDIADVVYTIRPHTLSALIDNDGIEQIFFYCTGREGNTRKPFAECKEMLTEMVREEAFERSMQEMQKHAAYEVDKKAAKWFVEKEG